MIRYLYKLQKFLQTHVKFQQKIENLPNLAIFIESLMRSYHDCEFSDKKSQ